MTESTILKGHEVSFSNNDWILSEYPLQHEITNNLFSFFL